MLSEQYKKRSFRRFRVTTDTEKLVGEIETIPQRYWATTYWGQIHNSVGMLLLRGGNQGTEQDFTCEEVFDNELLESLPYINHLIGEDGPFGKAKYAFIFRMIPNGVTIVHQDLHEVWKDMYRIHIPITTNPDAVLMSDGKMMHYAPGNAWTFDNQSIHGVANGNSVRTHLIFDVAMNDKLMAEIDRAEYLPGWEDAEKLELIRQGKPVSSYPGDASVKETINTLKSYGWKPDKIVEFLEKKGIPTSEYGGKWSSDAIYNLVPLIFW